MAGYGYTQPRYGTQAPRRLSPFTSSPLTKAAAPGAPRVGDPFGLMSTYANSPTKTIDGGVTAPHAQPVQAPVATPPPATAQTPQTPTGPQAPQTPTPAAYDINTDPVLQQVSAYAGMSDAQASAQADKEKRDAILQSGLEELAKSVFSGDENLAKATAANPTSTKAQLTHTRDESLTGLLNALVPQNLAFSGYRVKQEGELGNQFENALAQAASGVNSQLGQIDSGLLAAKGGNADRRASALSDAYSRMVQAALANPPVGAQQGTTPDHLSTTDLTGTPGLVQALMPGGFATRTRRFAA